MGAHVCAKVGTDGITFRMLRKLTDIVYELCSSVCVGGGEGWGVGGVGGCLGGWWCACVRAYM